MPNGFKTQLSILLGIVMLLSTTIVIVPNIGKAGSSDPNATAVKCWRCLNGNPDYKFFQAGTICGQGDASGYPYSSTPSCGGGGNNNPPTARIKVIQDGVETTTVIKGETCKLDASGSSDSDGSIVKYEWKTSASGGWISTNGQNYKLVVYNTYGEMTVSVRVTDNDGDTDTASKTITVINPDNKPPVANAGGGAYKRYFGDAGYPVHFSGSGYDPDGVYDQDGNYKGVVRHDWKFFEGDSWHNNIPIDDDGYSHPSHTYNSEGEYTVTIRVWDYYGATDTGTATVYIGGGDPDTNQPPVPIISQEFYWTSVGKTVTFDGSQSYDPDGGIIAHYWYVDDIIGQPPHSFGGGNCPPTTASYKFTTKSPSSGWLVSLGVRDNDCALRWTTARVFVSGPPDLVIDKIDDPDPVKAGEILIYNISVCNNDVPRDPLIIDDYDQDNLTVIDTDGGHDNGDTIVWDHVDIPGGDCVKYTIKFRVDECVPDGTIIKNEARVLYDGKEIDRATASTTVYNDKICGFDVDKKVTKKSYENWVDKIDADIGETVRFRFTIENNADESILLFQVKDLLPNGLKYMDNATVDGVSKEPDSILNNPNGTTILIWSFRSIKPIPSINDFILEPGESTVFEFDALVVDCGDLINNVNVMGILNPDFDGSIKQLLKPIATHDTATVHVECLNPDIKIVKTHDVCGDCVKIGDTITYTYTVTNTGETTLHSITVTDDKLGSISLNATTLEPEEYAIGTATYTVTENDLPGPITNTATATGYDSQQNQVTDQDTQTIEICTPQPDISIEKYVKLDCQEYQKEITANIGDTATFKIIVNNTGDRTLYDIIVEDQLPLGLSYNIGTSIPNEPETDDNLLTWNFTELNVEDNIIIEFTADINDCGNWTNNVDVSAHDLEENIVRDNNSAIINVECPPEPCLKYSPQEHDFGYMQECEIASTTFEIWNGCEGVLEYTITAECPWVSVNITDGNSTGEHDTVEVTINTAGFYQGTVTCEINIISNGGNGTFNITVTVGQEPEEPILAYNPDSYDFGVMNAGETDSADFDIWNAGSGTLTYSILENCAWLSISSTTGDSEGEHHTITVDINTTGLTEEIYTYDIQINSNGGNGTFPVTVTIGGTGSKPTVELIKPRDGKIYFINKELFNFPRTIIIGPITIQANASDADGYITHVEFLIDGEQKYNTTEKPYSYEWTERAIGLRTITVKAYDNDGYSKETELSVLIFNLGLGSK